MIKKKIEYLDGLRGWAALIVVLDHYLLAFYPAFFTPFSAVSHTTQNIEGIISKTPLNLFYDGDFSVCLFFILSGYVLSYRYFMTGDSNIILSTASKRYLRLVIPILGSVLFAYTFLKLGFYKNQNIAEITKSGFMADGYLFQADFIKAIKDGLYGALFFGVRDYNPVLWTMPIEFLGSFYVFGLTMIFGKVRYRMLFWFFALLVFSKSYYVAFIFGLILADLYNSKDNTSIILKLKKYSRWIATVALIAGLLFASYPIDTEVVAHSLYRYFIPVTASPSVFYHIIGAFLLLIAVLNSNILQRILSWRISTFLGKISFSMYLIHFILLNSISCYLFGKSMKHFSYNESFFISFSLSLVIIFVVSYLFYRFVDSKATSISNTFYQKYIMPNVTIS